MAQPMASPCNRRLLTVAPLFATLLTAPPATPAEVTSTSTEPPAPARHHRLSFQLGAGAPLGVLGIAWAFAPGEHFPPVRAYSLLPQLKFGLGWWLG
jgi:hypothetical protein